MRQWVAVCRHAARIDPFTARQRLWRRRLHLVYPTLSSEKEVPWATLDKHHLPSLKSCENDLYVVSGASRGIGLEFTRQLLSRTRGKVASLARDPECSTLQTLNAEYPGRVFPIQVDLTCQASVQEAGDRLARLAETHANGRIDLLLNTAGILGDGSTKGQGPERTLAAVDRKWLTQSLEVNLVGHVMMTKELMPLLKGSKEEGSLSKVVNLSARVGSIEDNRLGGWLSYRMSKSALNQFTKTASIELKRFRCIVLSLHPGTTDTDLSVPFQKNVPHEKLFPAWYSCGAMLDVVWGASQSQSGKFFAWDGSEIPW